MASNGRAGSIPAPSTSNRVRYLLIADSVFCTRRVTQSVGGVSGDLSAWSCSVAEAYCFGHLSTAATVRVLHLTK